MFVLSKVFYLLFKPGNLWLFIIVLGTALLWLPGPSARRWARVILTLAVIAALAVAVGPVSNMAMVPLENRFPPPQSLPAHIDGIIILGGAIDTGVSTERGQIVLSSGGPRLTVGITLAKQHPEARILFTGGSGDLFDDTSEAPLAKRFLVDMGIDPSRILLEPRSRNTYENAIFSKALVDPQPGQNWVLITSAFHMPRSVGIFRAAGWKVIPYPVGYMTTSDYDLIDVPEFADGVVVLNYAVKEWIGLIAYRILGRTRDFYPAPGP